MATSNEHAEFCRLVKARRNELGLTQAQVAERLGITRSAYAYIETGKFEPGLNQVIRVAKALEATARDLMPESSEAGV